MILRTKRLILREFEESDIADLVEGLNNYEVSKWLYVFSYPFTESDANEFIVKAMEDRKVQERTRYAIAICLKETNKVIGCVWLTKIDKGAGTAKGGALWVNSNYGGRGYGVEALREGLRFAFEDLGLKQIETGFFEGNRMSENMQKKLGFKIVGKQRRICKADGLEKNEIRTCLLRKDWVKTARKNN